MFDYTPWELIHYSFVYFFMLIGYASFLPHVIAVLYAHQYLYRSPAKLVDNKPITSVGGKAAADAASSTSSSSSSSLSSSSCASSSSSPSSSLSSSMDSLGVTILKPLVGIDSHLVENLSSFFTLNYPLYELLFCVASPHDPVCDVVRSLMATYPHIDAQLLTSAHQCGINHKVNNMNQGFVRAKNDIILISDSGIYMRQDTLLDMMQVMMSQDRVAMVHQVPYMKPLPGLLQLQQSHYAFSRCYQQVYFGSWHARNYLAAGALGISCTTGMSTLMRKSVLKEAGGLAAFAGYLAEDFFITKFMVDRGYRILLAHQPAWQNPPTGSVQVFHDRLQRWYQMRLMMVPATALLEPCSDCFLMTGLITLLWRQLLLLPESSLSSSSSQYSGIGLCAVLLVFLLHSGVWFWLDYALFCYMHPPGEPLGVTFGQYVLAWTYREVFSIPLQLRAITARNVVWRNKVYRLHYGGKAEDITPSASVSQHHSHHAELKQSTTGDILAQHSQQNC